MTVTKSKMTIADRVTEITWLQELEIPHHVRTLFGDSIRIFGDQIAFTPDGDYVSLSEAREAIEWLASQLRPGPPELRFSVDTKIGRNFFRKVEGKLGKKAAEAYRRAVNSALKEIDEHFEREDAGGLDFSHYVSEIHSRVCGGLLDWHLIGRLCRKGYVIGSSPEKTRPIQLITKGKNSGKK